MLTAARRWSAFRCPTTRRLSWLRVPRPARSPWCLILGSADRMAVIALGSAAGSPGVTTSALGLALTWPRPVLLIEADPTGGSAMLAGFFRGTTAHTAGLIDLAWAQREGLLTDALAELPMPIPDSSASLLPGIRSHTQAGSLAALWEPLAAALKRLHDTGRRRRGRGLKRCEPDSMSWGRRPVCKPCWWGRAGLTADGMLPRFWGCRWWRR